MRHDVVETGWGCRLRPVDVGDAAFILALRTNPELCRYIPPLSGEIEEQVGWIKAYQERPGDYYFVIERLSDNRAEGVISLYDLDGRQGSAEWGRWLVRPGSLCALESVVLLLRVAFERLDLDVVYSRTAVDNVQVVSFHESCGMTRHCTLPARFVIGNRVLDALEHWLTRSGWRAVRPDLEDRARRAAPLVTRTR